MWSGADYRIIIYMSSAHPAEYATVLTQGLTAINCPLPAPVQQQLLAYHGLLIKWNKAYNLTGIREPQAMLTQLLLDSLVALPILDHGPVIDVGSGGGVPGLPLAIARPDLAFTLVDSNGKKTRFINHVVTTLQLPNVDVVQSRIESYTPSVPARWVISRAFSELAEFIALTRHLLATDGQWLAWKANPQDELTAVMQHAELRQTIPVHLPGVNSARCLLVLAPK